MRALESRILEGALSREEAERMGELAERLRAVLGEYDVPDPNRQPYLIVKRSLADFAFHVVVTDPSDAAIGELPEDQRRALELAYFEGLTHQEIAERTATPLGTVKTRVRLGLMKLRERIRPYRKSESHGA